MAYWHTLRNSNSPVLGLVPACSSPQRSSSETLDGRPLAFTQDIMSDLQCRRYCDCDGKTKIRWHHPLDLMVIRGCQEEGMQARTGLSIGECIVEIGNLRLPCSSAAIQSRPFRKG